MRGSVRMRFWSKVVRDGPIPTARPDLGPCWLWIGSISSGYGNIRILGKSLLAHRIAYELANGPIPDGHELDHLCRITNCVRPAHLEPVPHRVNMARGIRATRTECQHGHKLTFENTILERGKFGTVRRCRKCRAAQGK